MSQPRMRPARWPIVLVIIVLIIPGLLLTTRTTVIGLGPRPDPQRITTEQVRFLQSAIADGAARRMQGLFPEGSFFSYALSAAAAARTGDPDQLQVARAYRDRLENPAETEIFGTGLTPEHGIFAAGWTLMVGNEVAVASGSPVDRQWVADRAPLVLAGLTSSATGFPASYPGQYWPCDAVVAAAAVATAAGIVNQPQWLGQLRDWRTLIMRDADPQLGLLAHRVDAAGRTLIAPRGSSQAIIQAFWPQLTRALDGHADLDSWRRFTSTFVVRTAGLVGVRQFPRGQDGGGDVDSGPLVRGVSLSATVVGLAAARSVGDLRLADALDRQAELFGLGLSWSGRRSYAFGQLPIGDAFLVWARTRPFVPDQPTPSAETSPADTPTPLWPALIGVSLAPLVLGAVLLALLLRRRQRHRPRPNPRPRTA